MAISDQLTALNDAKQAIKTAIEAKGVPVGTAPLSQYAAKINAITGGGGGDPRPGNAPGTWTRPSDWLTLPAMTESENKCHILGAVFPTGSSVSFIFNSAYTVDWGDGSAPENFANGATASHTYDYNAISSSTSCSRGYRQVIITVTPQAGQLLYQCSLGSVTPPGSNTTVLAKSIYLDLDFQFKQLNTFTGSTITVSTNSGLTGSQASLLEKARLVAINGGSSDIFFSSTFIGCVALQKVDIDTQARKTYCTSMFQACPSLAEAPMFAINGGATMTSMFNGCANLVSVPQYDTSAVTNFSGMFAGCSSLLEVPLLNTVAATDMSNMFSNCTSLRSCPEFNTANVTTMASMFLNCNSIVVAPNLNTTKVTTMSSMFYGCKSLLSVPTYDTANVTIFTSMFQGCNSIEDIPPFSYAKGTTFTNMFNGCSSIRTFGTLNLPVLVYINGMFNGCSSITEGPTITGPTYNIADTSSMFTNCSAMSRIPAYNFQNSNTSANMFQGCNALTEIPEGTIISASANTTNGVSSMIDTCHNLRRIRLSNLRHTINLTTTQLAAAEVQNVIDNVSNLGTGNAYTLAMGSCPGAIANPSISKSASATTANSTAVTVANTTSLAVGTYATSSTLVSAPCTFDGTAKTVTRVGHGLVAGDEVAFSTITTTTGLVVKTTYYVVNPTADTFQISATSGGSPISFNNNGTGTIQFQNWIVAINSATSITMKCPCSTTSASTTLAFRNNINTQRAVMKGWSVTG